MEGGREGCGVGGEAVVCGEVVRLWNTSLGWMWVGWVGCGCGWVGGWVGEIG